MRVDYKLEGMNETTRLKTISSRSGGNMTIFKSTMRVQFNPGLLTSLLILTVMLAAGCSWSQSKGPTESSVSDGTGNSSSKTTAVFSPSSDPRKDLREALEKLNSAYPYRLTEVSSGSANGKEVPPGTRVVDFAAADRSHAKWTSGPLGDTEVITIGDKQYMKLNNGNWIVGSPAGLAQREGTAERMRDLLAKVIKDVKYVGPQTVNGVACHAYTYTIDGELAGQRWAGTGKSWISASDGVPRQIDSELTTSSYQAKSHITYEYNVNVKVEKPAM